MKHLPRRSRTTVLAGGAVALTLVLAGCGGSSTTSSVSSNCTPKQTFSTVKKGTLTVATYDFNPHTILKGDQLSGVEGDLLKEVAARECLTLAVSSAGGANAAVPSVQSGRADLAAGDWWRTKARAKIVTLSDPVYLDQGAIISKAGYKNLAALDGKKIGSVVGNLWNDEMTKVFGDKFVIYQDGESEFSDLANGRIDAVIDSVGATVARFKTSPIKGAQIVSMPADPRVPTSAAPGQVNWPTSKKNPELTAAINAQITALRADGTIAKILKKYGLDAKAAVVGNPREL
ncbi:ABC transporter substrate-binding protein [Streptomyces sp. NPDC048277]|uniref:substrate-binding periplasmic protein n=1 Tax=Streptomyces sp. NPDC048277 TaxID=3155027 RepID=UPI0033C4D526